ncbi:TetR/AcrR family transcriptional regulator [Rhodanobacter sp. DHB23]|uniref:TetR/AcrR family transcriptional regulator n=1 Tax=Rhodanobacter sp. DHB23 TaxID=2775923 RepID=UPI00177ADF55|nr:TetR/AcrR family transcriptional regulator [Rhodanobacter sp. DHB23]MBD8871849.1 TetR/AcrR family transcriptional regulator [Rhodanobacter sp. DHB23]
MKRLTTAEKILRAAHKLFDREGGEAVTMRRVAELVGITPMAIYRHFPNREALLKRIADDSFQSVADSWQEHDGRAGVIERLCATQMLYLDYALAHPHLFDHAFSVRRDDARQFPGDFRARRSPTLNVVADTLAEGMREGVLRKDDPWDVAMTFWAHTHGLIALYRAGRFSYDEEQFRAFYRASIGRLLDGIRI